MFQKKIKGYIETFVKCGLLTKKKNITDIYVYNKLTNVTAQFLSNFIFIEAQNDFLRVIDVN